MIPALRRFCHTVSADAQLHEAKHYLRSSLFSLINSLHIWSSSAVREENGARNANEAERVLERALGDAVGFLGYWHS